MNRFVMSILLLLVFFTASLASDSIDFDNAQILDVIKILSEQAGFDLVISGDPGLVQNKRITLHLNGVSAEAALLNILQTNDLTYEKRGNGLSLSFAANEEGLPGNSKVVHLKYLDAKRALSLLSSLISNVKASEGSSSNLVVLRGKPNNLAEASRLLASLDQPVPQILIESQVVEITESDSLRLGVAYGQTNGTYISDQDVSATINALVSSGKAKVVASPKIATLDNHEAVINIGNRIPYAVPVSSSSSTTQWAVNYIDAGVKLKIIPRLGASDEVFADIQPEVSSISEWRTTAAGEFPVITTRNAQSTVRVKTGETIVVGGLISETDRVNVAKMPILGYLPIIGFIFQNKTVEKAKTEIVFMITPRVI